MVKAIFFDLDDTLLWDEKSVKESFRLTCLEAKHRFDIDPVELESAVRKEARELYASYETYDFTKMIGINPFEGLWGNFGDDDENFRKMNKIVPEYRKEAWTKGLKALGIDDPKAGEELAELFPANRRKSPFLYEESIQILGDLKGKYQLLMLTNGSPELQNEKLTMTPELVPYFDKIIISGAFGRGKPDPTIFEHALEQLDLDVKDALMVGDNLNTDILGASRVGMKSVWINRSDKEPNPEIQPTYVITHLEELFGILEGLR